jgi:cell division protein FtsZ
MSEYGNFAQDGMDFSIVGPMEEPRVAVVGCGGAGCNIVEHLYWEHPEYDTIAVNDSAERLSTLSCSSSIYVRPEDIQDIEDIYSEKLQKQLQQSDIVFVVAGIGGSFGSVAGPFVASAAAQLGLTVISICIQPFSEENRSGIEDIINRMRASSCATVVIDNNSLHEVASGLTLEEGFQIINRAVSKIVETVIARITEQLHAVLQLDFTEELRYDIMSLAEQPSDIMPASPVSGVEAAQSYLFTVHGPYLHF